MEGVRSGGCEKWRVWEADVVILFIVSLRK